MVVKQQIQVNSCACLEISRQTAHPQNPEFADIYAAQQSVEYCD